MVAVDKAPLRAGGGSRPVSSSCCEDCGLEAGAQVREGRGRLSAVIVAGVLLAAGMVCREVLNTPYHWAAYLMLLSAYLLVGGRVIRKAWRSLRYSRFFDENVLMTVATAGAVAINQLPEAVAVMLFYAVGEHFQAAAVGRSRRSITALLGIRPGYANLIINGDTRRVRPEEVAVGQIIVIRPGERVPLDGEVVRGCSFIDTSALTGESIPRKAEVGDSVHAGAVNGPGLLEVKVNRPAEESSMARILDLVRKAAARKAPTEQFITTFARYYTPAVVAGALLIAVVPPLFISGAAFSEWVYRALVLLVISCPCALMVSIPLSYFGGLGGASRRGIMVKGANFLDALTRVHTVVFDKTGTLTKGVFKVTGIEARNGFNRDEVLKYAAAVEANSNHPIARSILDAWGDRTDTDTVIGYQEVAGGGVKGTVQGRAIVAGNGGFLRRENISYDDCGVEGTTVYVAVDGVFAGYLAIADELKEDAAEAVAGLKRLGVKRTVMLTGDGETTARRVASALNLDSYVGRLLPEEKLARVEELRASMPDPHRDKLMFVGDGINDAPVITRADIGAAMGGLGADAAIEAADLVVMDDRPGKLADAVRLALRTRRIVLQNIALALGIKAFFLVLGIMGVATICEAVFADVGVTLIAVLNAARTLRAEG